MFRISSGVVLMAIAIAFGSQQLEAQTQRQGQAVTSLSHNIGTPPASPVSPFFSQATGSDGTVYDFVPAFGIGSDLVAGAGNTANVSGTLTIVGNANAITNFNDGNRLPRGITLTYDLSFTISTSDGDLVSANGNTGNGIAPGALPDGVFDPGEAIEFSAATISAVAFTGTPLDAGVTFTPGTVTGVGISQFRSNNFGEAANGAILGKGNDSVGFGDTVGFGLSMGTLASAVAINNGFSAANRFPALLMDGPITLINDAAAGTFNIKGIEFTTFFDFEIVSPFDGMNVALTDFSHNINPGPFSPFFTQSTGDDGTVYDFTAEQGLVGSIVVGAADTTTVSGTVDIVGTATAAENFTDGNQLPEGVTLSYGLSFSVSSPDGLLTTSGGNTGNGIGVGSGQFEAIDNGEELVFSPITISNVTFTGAPVGGGGFVPGDVTGVSFTNFRSANFPEVSTGAVLSNGTDSVGFGLATGTLADSIPMNNSFAANARFPGFPMTDTLTLTNDVGTSSFNLKGFELATIFTYETGSVLKGDVDLNGAITFLDIQPFIGVLSSATFQAEADCDCDGDVDFLDIQPFVEILASQ